MNRICMITTIRRKAGFMQPNMRKNALKALDEIIPHVRSGSSKNHRDCWISAYKDFEICIQEYAVPQAGEFCTANGRKNIAVIEIPYPDACHAEADNYTLFFDKQHQPIQDTYLRNFPRPTVKLIVRKTGLLS